MNAFALILLSWPFYLAVNGRLSEYVDLAKPGKERSGDTGTANTAGESSDSSALVDAAVLALATV